MKVYEIFDIRKKKLKRSRAVAYWLVESIAFLWYHKVLNCTKLEWS
jgi:hypothetical protein